MDPKAIASWYGEQIMVAVVAAFGLGFVCGGGFMLFLAWVNTNSTPPQPKPTPVREYYQQCQTCGEWLYSNEPPTTQVESCPLCPMSVEEFEELKRKLKGGE